MIKNEQFSITAEKDASFAKSSVLSGSWTKTQNGDQNRIYTFLTLQTAKFFPLKRVFKKPNITMESPFWVWVFGCFLRVYWVFIRHFWVHFKKCLKNVLSILEHCNFTLVEFKSDFSPFKICFGQFFWLKLKLRVFKIFCVRTGWNPYEKWKK